jgi:2,4-dienoyl-CoA reductase-like NADH-dependent reductase (Old Yellow Enzyme family)
MPRLEDPIDINGVTLGNRLYRAPVLECAGNGPDAPDIYKRELVPSAESGVGLICQGSCLVTETTGKSAPGLTRVHDPDFVETLEPVTDAIHEAGSKVFMQIGHGGIECLETWHRGYAREHPDMHQLAVSELPGPAKWMDRLGLLNFDPKVMTTEEVHELASKFGDAAGYAYEAGYDGIHLSAANASLIQQFLSPFFNKRDDEFGGDLEDRVRFLEVVHDEIRDRVGPDVPLITKVPAESSAPAFVRNRLTVDEGVRIAEMLEDIGYDAVVPVQVSVFREASVAKGAYPAEAWSDERYQEDYAEAFGSRLRTRLLRVLNRLWSVKYDFEPVWNEPYFRQVKDAVDVPVLAVGGIRERGEMDRLLSEGACDMVGMARPFYAEPRLAARILRARDGPDTRVICESCNNCTIPQVAGAPGTCRTPHVMERRAELEAEGAYEVDAEAQAAGDP